MILVRLTEPGTPTAHAAGCTCPPQQPQPNAAGGCAWTVADDCPLHPAKAVTGQQRRATRRWAA